MSGDYTTYNPINKNLAGKSNVLKNTIVGIVAARKQVSLREMTDLLAAAHDLLTSRATLYRHVAELVDSQVLIRHKKHLSLNLVWVSDVIKYGREFEKLLDDSHAADLGLPLKEFQKKKFIAQSLKELDPIWNNIHLWLGLHCPETEWYGYNSRPWHALGLAGAEKTLHENLVFNDFSYNLLYGNTGSIDEAGQDLVKTEGYNSKLEKCHHFMPEGHALWAGAEYVIEVIFPDKLAADFGKLFDADVSYSEPDKKKFEDLFSSITPITLELRRSKSEAAKWRKILTPYF